MRLRVLLEPHHGATYRQILALAQATEDAGFDAFFRSDHYLGIDADDVTYQPTDSWTTLAGLAVQTSRVRIGTLVTAATYRLPGQLAVEVATVDQMSGGRAELGIGTGWFEREHQYFGIPFPPTGERFDRFEEQLAIITGLWDTPPGERFSFEGKHYQLTDCASIPRPAARPKIIIGGAGAKRTPTLAAKYADEFNGALGLQLRERYANFKRICEDVVGRDPATVRLSATVPVCIGADAADLERRKESLGAPGARLLAAGVTAVGGGEVLRVLEDLAAQGADTVYFHVYGADDPEHLRLLGSEVVTRMQLSPGGTTPRTPGARPIASDRIGRAVGRHSRLLGKLVRRFDAVPLRLRQHEVCAGRNPASPAPVGDHKTMSRPPDPVELLTMPPQPPAAWRPGAGEPGTPRPRRPRLSPAAAYLMQKVLAPGPVKQALGAAIERWPLARKMFTTAERASKERLFGCRMCAQCALPVTGYSCPMGCPKELRNGPCGGVGPGGACEVHPGLRCVWVVGYERAAAPGRQGGLRRLQRPVDHRKFGESSWLNYWAGRDENLWTGDDVLTPEGRPPL